MFKKHLILIAVILFLTAACETPDDNTVESIRSCVNNASKVAISNPAVGAQNAAGCDTMASNSSIQTLAMTEIRFGIILIIEQKLTQVAQMAQSLQSNPQASSSGLISAVAVMVFNAAPGSDSGYASRILAYGNAIGGNAALLGNMIYLATSLSSISTITNSTTALTALQACATNQPSCPAAEQQSLANSIYGMEQGACTSPSDQTSTNPSDPCFQMKTALNGATPSNPALLLQNFYAYASAPH